MKNIALPGRVALKHRIQVNTAAYLKLEHIFVFAVTPLFLTQSLNMTLVVGGPIFMRQLLMGLLII